MFKMINESFVCENCGKKVPIHPKGSARNHCPFCLYSKHLDENFPGDRASACGGLMKPIGIVHKRKKGKGQNMIEHKCNNCGKVILNIFAPDDNFDEICKLVNNGFSVH